jgi:nucleotide-binding universal stress UspA family protein
MNAIDQNSAADSQSEGERLWKFLVVVDDTPEFQTALRFASLRAAKVGGGVTMLYIIPPSDFQHWGAVELLMREEAQQAAEAHLRLLADKILDFSGIMPETVIREGMPSDLILAHIKKDKDIRILVLGASTNGGPGPLVSAFGGPLLQKLRVPLVIVPGNLSDKQIDRLA